MANDNEKALQMLSTALNLEERGEKFYTEAVGKCKTKLGKELFEMLRKDELVHMQRIRNIFESVSAGKGWTEDWKKLQFEHGDIKALFADIAKKHGKDITPEATDIEALDVGIDLERHSMNLYGGYLKNAENATEKTFLDRMVMEERAHFDALLDMKDYLSDAAAWFMKKERHLPVGP